MASATAYYTLVFPTIGERNLARQDLQEMALSFKDREINVRSNDLNIIISKLLMDHDISSVTIRRPW